MFETKTQKSPDIDELASLSAEVYAYTCENEQESLKFMGNPTVALKGWNSRKMKIVRTRKWVNKKKECY